MRVEEATSDMFEDIYAVLRGFGNVVPKQCWRELMAYRWARPAEHRGYVLRADDERVVGFIGTVFSQRPGQDGQPHKFANLTSWIVEPEFRHGSMRLIMRLRELTDYTLVSLTPAAGVLPIFKRMGFVELESHLVVVPPLPRFGAFLPSAAQLVQDRAALERILSPTELQMLRDHEPYNCHHLVVEAPDGYCYVVYSRTRVRNRWPVIYVHHVSNPQLFRRHFDCIHLACLRRVGGWALTVDARLLGGSRLPLAYHYPLRQQRLYRPAKGEAIQPADIDSMYSELLLLDPEVSPFLL